MAGTGEVRGGRLARTLLFPLLDLIDRVRGGVARLIARRGDVPTADLIEEQLESVIHAGVAEGVMDTGEGELLRSCIEFGDTLVREVMVPRVDIAGFPIDTPLPAVLERVERLRHSRWPVYRENLDHVAGIMHAKDLLLEWRRGAREVALGDLLRPAIFVPEGQRISVLLREFKKRRTHMAIVLDEFGGTAGLVTLEDLVEEIIGEVADEFDHGQQEGVREGEGGWVVDSRTALADLGERLGIPEGMLADRHSETVGGLMSELLGRLPRAGDEAALGAYRLRVADTDGRRILRIHVRRAGGA